MKFLGFGRAVKPQSERSELYLAVDSAMAPARAYAKSHAGDIQLIDVTEDGDVIVKLRGSCALCPLATITLKVEVERRLRERVPGIRRILTK